MDVGLGSAGGDHKPVSDFRVRKARRDHAQDFYLALAQDSRRRG
jgi:hypothetical protein